MDSGFAKVLLLNNNIKQLSLLLNNNKRTDWMANAWYWTRSNGVHPYQHLWRKRMQHVHGLSLPLPNTHTHTHIHTHHAVFLYLEHELGWLNIQYFYTMALELLNCWRESDRICKSVNEKAVHTVKIHRHCRTNRESETKSSLKLKPRISHAKRHTSDNKRNHQSGHHVHGFCGEIRTQS